MHDGEPITNVTEGAASLPSLGFYFLKLGLLLHEI